MLILMLIRISPITVLKIDSTTDDLQVILKSLLTRKRSICSGVCFQYSCEWYTEQIKLLKMLNFRRLSNNYREIYEVSFLEACRV